MIFERWAEWFPQLLEGLGVSLLLTLCVVLVGFPLGLVFGLLSTHKNRVIRTIFIVFIELRATKRGDHLDRVHHYGDCARTQPGSVFQ